MTDNQIETLRKSFSKHVFELLDGTLPIKQITELSHRGVAWLSPNGKEINQLAIAQYSAQPPLLRLSLNRFTIPLGKSCKPLGLKSTAGIKIGSRELKFTFSPSEVEEVAEWVAFWIPLFEAPSIPMTLQTAEKATDLRGRDYLWTVKAQEEYDAVHPRPQSSHNPA